MTDLEKKWQAVAEEAILEHFRCGDNEPFHSDDLWPTVPLEYRGVISLAVMALVNKKLITGCGHRKSAIPSRKRSPSQEYRLTELGRDRIVGAGGGSYGVGASFVASPHSGDRSAAGVTTGVSVSSHCSMGASSDPGDGSSAHGRQPTHGAGEPRPIAEVVPLFEEDHQPLSLVTDPEAA